MKLILFGLGSIGRRQFDNLRFLRPGAGIVIAEPLAGVTAPVYMRDGGEFHAYRDWRRALTEHRDADGAIIASPTDAHIAQMCELAAAGIPFYVEKPLWRNSDEGGTMNNEWGRMAATAVLGQVESRDLHCAVGFQYRYNAAVQANRETWRRNGFMSVAAYDDLLARYGRTVGGTMASHPIDLALWTLGDWHSVDLFSDGVVLRGAIAHEGMGFSHFDIRMVAGARTSQIATHGQAGAVTAELNPDNDMYLRALDAWLDYVEMGRHDGTLATLGDGLAVMRVLDEVKAWKGSDEGGRTNEKDRYVFELHGVR